MIRIIVLGVLALGVAALSATSAFSQDSDEQTISATVSGQSVSMTVSPTSIDYGTVPFETSRTSLAAPGGPVTFVATNTGNVTEDFLVRGTNATGSGFTWTLDSGPIACPNNLNQFRHSVTPASQSSVFLTTADDTLSGNIAASGNKSFTSEIYMPCFGSDGAGLQATTSIVVTAVATQQ
jgi:hypothetical protein